MKLKSEKRTQRILRTSVLSEFIENYYGKPYSVSDHYIMIHGDEVDVNVEIDSNHQHITEELESVIAKTYNNDFEANFCVDEILDDLADRGVLKPREYFIVCDE